jgi:small GTP-binding protein
MRLTQGRFVDGVQPSGFAEMEILKARGEDGHELTLRFLDTQGQEQFGTLTSSQYRKIDLVVLAFDPSDRDTYDNLPSWHKDVVRMREVPIVVVATRMDLLENGRTRTVSKQEGETLARSLSGVFVETSAKTGLGIEELLAAICRKLVATSSLS